MYYLGNFQALDARLSGRRRNDQFFTNLVKVMNLGVAVTDYDRKILYFNEHFKAFTANPDNNRLGKDLADSFDALNGEVLRAVYQDCFINNKASIELGWQDPRGRQLTVRISLTAFDTDCSNSKLVFAVLSDITEFKDAQKAIIRSENRYKAVVENSLTGLFIAQDQQIVFANRRLADILAYPMKHLIGKPIHQVFPSCDNPFNDEVQTFRKDGKDIWLKMTCQSIIFNGRTADLYNVMEISREKTMENRLLHLEKELTDLANSFQADQSSQKKKLAQDLHNGIGKSLTASRLIVEQLLQTDAENAQSAKPLNKIAGLLQNAADATRRITMNLDPTINEDCGLKSTINWHCHQYQSIYPTIKIALNVNVNESKVTEALKTAVYRILQGVLTSIIEHYGTTQIKIHLFATADKLNLAIKDNGISLSFNKDEVDRRPYFGVDQSSIKAIVRQSGGKLAAGKNLENQENYYYFSWPIHASA